MFWKKKDASKNLILYKFTVNGFEKILDLGLHPFADTFIEENKLHLPEPCYPLECYMNSDTGEISLGIKTKAFERYNLYDYSYTSSNSTYSKNHWNNFAFMMNEKFDLKNKKILEIGSNDGYLLEKFKNSSVLGVDASNLMVEIALQKNIKSLMGVFDFEFSKKLNEKFDFIFANNVLNHSNDIIDFIEGVKNVLSEKGYFIFEVPYWGEMVDVNNFDQIYHEHITYFTFKYLNHIFQKCNLNFFDFEFINYHGKSIRGYVKNENFVFNEKIKKYITFEEESNYYNSKTYQTWQENILKKRFAFMEKINHLKNTSDTNKIIGIGAAAKANTFLNFCKIDAHVMDFITDASPFKQNKFTPLSRIPIKDDLYLKDLNDAYAIILSWNMKEILIPKIQQINDKIKFLEF